MSGATNRILAIDGPAGAGKSTLAGHMAARFGLLNIETGAMYRAFALKALRLGVPLSDERALEQLSKATGIVLVARDEGNGVLLDREDVTALLRTSEISGAASEVSVHPPIRSWLVRLQQEIGRAAANGVVMEGRDIGTVVFPDASLKIFLSASPEARSERRLLQNGAPAQAAASLLESLKERDARDRSRAVSPLHPAPDAVLIDSTGLTLEAVVERVASLAEERWGPSDGAIAFSTEEDSAPSFRS